MGGFEDLRDQLQEILNKGAHASGESPGNQGTAPPREGGQGSDTLSRARDLDLMLQRIVQKGAFPPATLDELTRQGPRGVLMLNPGHVRALITKAIEDAAAGRPGKTPEQGPHALLIMDRNWLAAEIAAVNEILSTRARAEAAEHRHALAISQSASDNRVLQERQDRLRAERDMAAERAELETHLLATQVRETESRAQAQQLAQHVETLRQKLLEAERQHIEATTRSGADLDAMKGALHALQTDYRGALETLREQRAARDDAEQASTARHRALEAQVQSLKARESEALAGADRATATLRDLQAQSQGAQKQVAEALVETQRESREAAARQAEAEQRFQAQARELQDQRLAAERDKSSLRVVAEQAQARLAALEERLEEVQAGEREAKAQADRAGDGIRRLQEQLLSLERERGAAVAAAEQEARETATREAAAASSALEARLLDLKARESSAQAHTERLVAELQELRQRHPSVGSDEMEGLLTRFKADLTLALSRREAPSGRASPAAGNLHHALTSGQVDRALEEPMQSNLDDQAFATRRSGSSRRWSKAKERLQSIQKPQPKGPEGEPEEKGG